MTVACGLDAWPKCGRMCTVEFNVDIRARWHYVAMDPDLLKRLREVAQARGISAESLINLWLQECLVLQQA